MISLTRLFMLLTITSPNSVLKLVQEFYISPSLFVFKRYTNMDRRKILLAITGLAF